MWIQVRSFDGRKNFRVDQLSKLTPIEELRERLVEEFQAEPEQQRLFYRGKQVCGGSARLLGRTMDSLWGNSEGDGGSERK